MRYFIDGHNLIAQIPDINIADEDDEAQLVIKLRGFCARTGHKITVVFDGGLPGGISTTLSNSTVTAKFASAEKMNADQVLLGMIRKVKNPRSYTLVTSDRELLDAAESVGMPTMTTPNFIALLTPPSKKQADNLANSPKTNPRLSPQELAEWLKIFSPQKKEED